MSPENKQRVVGVVVLVAFIALLIPFLFTSGVKKRHKPVADEVIPALATAPVAADGVPVASGDQLPTAQQMPIQETNNGFSPNLPNELQQPAALPGVTENSQVVPPSPGTELPQSPVVAPAAPEVLSAQPINNNLPEVPVVANTVAVEPAVAAEPAKPVVIKAKKQPVKGKLLVKTKKVKGKHKPKVVSKAKTTAVVVASASWSVQVGSFSDLDRMQKFVTNLQTKGFPVYMQKILTSKGDMVRVLVGRETDKANAVKIANQLKTTLKINGRVVGNKK